MSATIGFGIIRREGTLAGSSPLFEINDRIRAHILEDTGTILVGTRDANLTPEIVRGWGPTILFDRHTIDLCISLAAGARTLKNLGECDEIAVTFHHTVSYRTVQLKGRFVESAEPTAEDWKAVERQESTLVEQAKAYNIPPEIGLRILSRDLVRIRFAVEQAFEQTPGPQAGSRL